MKKQLLFLLTTLILSLSANAQMVLEFNTNISDGTTITLPLNGTVDVTVNWGDETSNAYTAGGNQEHTYATEGTYTVTITGSLTQFGGGYTAIPNIEKLVRVTSFGNIGLTSLFGAFKDAVNLIEVPTSLPPTVTSTKNMFSGCASFNQNISSWNVSNVTDMYSMFSGSTSFNQDIGSWNVGEVTTMYLMFANCTSFNQDISSWNVSKVTDMAFMFTKAAAFNQNIGNWSVSNVSNMSWMFNTAIAFNQNISTWDVSKVTNMSSMFQGAAAFNQDLGAWNVTSVTNMTDMFKYVTLSTSNYNNLLIGWAGKTVQNGVVFNGGNSKYSSGEAAAARAVLTGTYNWAITDGGELSVPTVLTLTPSEITSTTAICGGEITADGGSMVTARGVVWSIDVDPTIEINTGITVDGDGMGTFISNITGLTGNTTYYVRAYATNAMGTDYGSNAEFTTENAQFTVTFTVTDNQGPLAEATISINEQMLTTNSEGIATIELENGLYPYWVSAPNHIAHEGSITVDGTAVDEDVSLVFVGVDINSHSNITVYPNPFQNTINISNARNVNRVVITNIIGKVVMNVNLNPSNPVIETNLPSGIYLVTIIADDGSKVVRKMIRK